jgi:putative tricarboxylic transport membrane protein
MPLDRRSFNQALLAAASVSLLPTSAARAQQLKSVKIIAPAGPGGGYDQLARAVQDVLTSEKIATSVQVVNVPGAGGTIGLAQFINSKERDPSLMVAGFGLVGAPIINKSPVTLEQTTPLARLQGEYQPLFVAANSPVKTAGDLVAKFKQDSGSVSWGGFALGSPDHLERSRR